MKGKALFRFLPLALSIGMILSCAGLYALWIYYYPMDTVDFYTRPSGLGAFQYGDTVVDYDDKLPQDSENGKNHSSLIEAMVNGECGLNHDTGNKSLHESILDRLADGYTYMGSMGVSITNHMIEDFGLNAGSRELSFVVEAIKTTTQNRKTVPLECYIYTTHVPLGSNNAPTIAYGNPIFEIFRTFISRADLNSEWVIDHDSTLCGYADSMRYEGSSHRPCFDVRTWTEGSLGNGFYDAIWTFSGYSHTVTPTASNVPTYFTVPSSGAGITLTVTGDTNTKLKIFDQSYALITTVSAVDSVCSYRFSTGTKYYFTVEGSPTIDIVMQ